MENTFKSSRSLVRGLHDHDENDYADDVESMPSRFLGAMPMSTTLPAHDDSHPDHVDILPTFHAHGGGLAGSLYPAESTSAIAPEIDRDRILRHRKVYVSKKKQITPIINPITITIPLKIPEDEAPLPQPKPVFKYKKFTTYETKPEIQMVPVTKTIIRPADVTPDQIIDDDGLKVEKDFKIKKL